MVETLSRDWWTFVFRGVIAVILGVIAFAFPSVTIAALTMLFGIYAFINGIVALVSAVRLAREHDRWGVALIEAILGIAAGIVAFTHTILTAIVLLYVMAGWAILTGIMELVLAADLRKQNERNWQLAVGGIVSILLGIALFVFPAAGLVAWAWMFGIYAVIFGIMLITFGLRLHHLTGPTGAIAQH